MGQRRFAIIGHRVPASGKIILNDLAGGSGRLDVLCRAVNTALFVSHGIREDTHVTLHLMGGEGPPRRIWFDGGEMRGVRVDERAIAGHIAKVLREPIPVLGQWPTASPGIRYSAGGLSQTLADWQREEVELFALAADAPALWSGDGRLENEKRDYGRIGFFLSDDLPFTSEENDLLSQYCALRSLGDEWLQGHVVIALVHQLLDLGVELNDD
jgi:tRNA (pseudouridine54-N1)-methyltransferase